jgi:choline dehydrogenase
MIFDDIIVGAGSSGAVLAARLSEDTDRRVLLLEAGPDYPSIEQTPVDLLDPSQVALSHDWDFTAEVVPRRSAPYPRGKVSGGTSAVNATLALRGVPADFDEWAAWGNDQWSWAKVLPFFCRLEDDPLGNPAFHGSGGPLPIRRRQAQELTPHQRALLDAFRALGYPVVADHNDPEASGAGPVPWNHRDNLRASTAIGYLLPARERANLTIRAKCTVDRIIFDGTRAIGLELEDRGAREIVTGRRITLSAGAIGSPTILLRSGIGPIDELRRLEIEPVVDSPGVGSNLIDHASVGFSQSAKEQIVDDAGLVRSWGILLRYAARESPEPNDMQALLVDLGPSRLATYFVACLMRSRSRGTVRLTNRRLSTAPEIRLNLASDPEDQRRLREGLSRLFELARSPSLAPFHTQTTLLDDGRVLPIDEAIAALAPPASGDRYVQQTVQHRAHAVGTARMGPDGDAGDVVDQYCRVRGVDNVRVVDASVMPNIPRANTNLTCIMIGERVADWLRRE